jgi:hypothetical protein
VTCSGCAFWRPWEHRPSRGDCRRMPPVVVLVGPPSATGFESQWPDTSMNAMVRRVPPDGPARSDSGVIQGGS